MLAGTNQILDLGFDQSSLLKKSVVLASVSTKIVQARTGTPTKQSSAKQQPNTIKEANGLAFVLIVGSRDKAVSKSSHLMLVA
jgi:hypothetical protein